MNILDRMTKEDATSWLVDPWEVVADWEAIRSSEAGASKDLENERAKWFANGKGDLYQVA